MDELAAKVAGFLVEFPGEHGVDDIAKGIRTRRVLVAEALAADPRFVSRETPGRRGGKREVWRLALVAAASLGQASSGRPLTKRGSQCARLLSILDDGQWHSSSELNRRVKCVLHSRIDELRERGHRTGLFTLEHRGQGFGPEHHEYRIVKHSLKAAA